MVVTRIAQVKEMQAIDQASKQSKTSSPPSPLEGSRALPGNQASASSSSRASWLQLGMGRHQWGWVGRRLWIPISMPAHNPLGWGSPTAATCLELGCENGGMGWN